MLLDSFCKVHCIGLIGLPSITFRDDGSVMASFKVATSLPLRTASKVAESIVWQNVIAFGAVAEFVRDHIPQGTRVYFEGAVYPTFVKDSNGTLIPQVHLAASRVIPLTSREDSSQLIQQRAQSQRPVVQSVHAVLQQEEKYRETPF